MVTLKISNFDTDGPLDIEDLLKIDHSNIIGEILTFGVLFNRIANLKAEMDGIVRHLKFDLDVFEAQLKDKKRNQIQARGDKATVDAVVSAVVQDPDFILKQRNVFARERDAQILDNLYWTAQSKSQLLQKLSDKVRPEEFLGEILEDTINGVMIKTSKKLIP